MPVAVPLRQDGVRLEVALVDHRHAVGLLEDEVGLGEALGHVAALELRLLGDVDGLRRWRIALGRGHARVGQRLAGVGLGPRVRHGRRARAASTGADRSTRAAPGTRPRSGRAPPRRWPARPRPPRPPAGPTKTTRSMASTACARVGAFFLSSRDVGGGEHGAHARQRLGPARVDADDPGVGVRAPEELRVQQAARLEVGDVLDLTRDLLRSVRPGDGEADALHLARGLHDRHGVIPFESGGAAAAVSAIAATIFV